MKNFGLVLALFFFSGCVLVYSNFDFSSEIKPLEETKLYGEGRDKILMIDISGEIIDVEETSVLGFIQTESMVSLLQEQLKAAETDRRIKAVLVRINSPGGSVTASDLLYKQLKDFREKSQIPMYAVMMDVAASGGYYLAMAADKIYAHPTTVTGSIGVIMFNLSFEGLMKKIGVASKVIKSGDNKDIGSPLKDLSPEERAILQSVIDDLYARFVDVVASGRPKLSREQVTKLADGRVYTSRQAKEAGLVDQVSYLPEIIEEVKADLRLDGAKVITFKRPDRNMTNIYSKLQGPLPQGLSLVDPAVTKALGFSKHFAGFYYLWEPAAGLK